MIVSPSVRCDVFPVLASAFSRLARAVLGALLAVVLAVPGQARAQPAAPSSPSTLAGLQTEMQTLALTQAALPPVEGEAGAAPARPRVEVVLGQLDPRLRLAPCDKIKVYVPQGAQMWGRTRMGLRCEQGAVRWNVYWPLTVKVWAPAVVAATALRPGEPITAADVRLAEVDLAATQSPAILRPAEIVGRSVVRAVAPGQGLRQGDIRQRRWFATGEPVQVLVKGQGFAVAAEGTALAPGDEGQCARIRVGSGRILCGQPVGDRRAEVTL